MVTTKKVHPSKKMELFCIVPKTKIGSDPKKSKDLQCQIQQEKRHINAQRSYADKTFSAKRFI